MTGNKKIASRLAERFADRWDQPLFVDSKTGSSHSYGQALHQGIALAEHIERAGVCAGDHVAIICRNSSELATFFLSCLYLGVVAVPIDSRLGSDEKYQLIKRSCCRVILSDETDLDYYRQEDCGIRRIDLRDCWTGAGSRNVRVMKDDLLGLLGVFENADSSMPYLVTFTSGTTSKPKGVCHSARSLFLAASVMNERIAVSAESVFYHCFSMSYMAGILNLIICPLMAGAQIVLDDPFDFRTGIRFWSVVEEFYCNIFWLAPSMMALIEKMDRAPGAVNYSSRYMHNVIVGTAPLPLRLRESFAHRYRVRILESYGLSETLFVSADCDSQRTADTGRLLDGVEVEFSGSHGEARLKEGELLIRSPWNFLGYFDEGVITSPVGVDDWFRTGDYGQITRKGSLKITSRVKDLIIRGGLNISPRRIEDKLMELDFVQEVAVVGLPDELEGEEIVAAVVLSRGLSVENAITNLFEFVLDELDSTMRPKRFIPVSELPKTSNGKVNKRMLRSSLSVE